MLQSHCIASPNLASGVASASGAIVSNTESACNQTLSDNDVLSKLSQFCTELMFKPGELVRQWGEHYSDALFILDGKLEVTLHEPGSEPEQRGAGPIGEIGFLWGTPACATITASENTRTLLLDDQTLSRVKRAQPALASAVLAMLTRFAQQRMGNSNALTEFKDAGHGERDIDVYLCRDNDQLTIAQSLRYDVYCKELGRSSPNACEEKGVIADELDVKGKTFIAVSNGQAVGTLRTNYAREGSLGQLENLYGMRQSALHPQATAVCTKFIIKPSARGGPAAIRLISSLTRHLIRHDIQECFIDCIPPLLHYYRAMGFEVAGEQFMHPETGVSIPLKIDLRRHGKLLSGAMGLTGMMQIYVKAKSYKLLARLQKRISPC